MVHLWVERTRKDGEPDVSPRKQSTKMLGESRLKSKLRGNVPSRCPVGACIRNASAMSKVVADVYERARESPRREFHTYVELLLSGGLHESLTGVQ